MGRRGKCDELCPNHRRAEGFVQVHGQHERATKQAKQKSTRVEQPSRVLSVCSEMVIDPRCMCAGRWDRPGVRSDGRSATNHSYAYAQSRVQAMCGHTHRRGRGRC